MTELTVSDTYMLRINDTHMLMVVVSHVQCYLGLWGIYILTRLPLGIAQAWSHCWTYLI